MAQGAAGSPRRDRRARDRARGKAHRLLARGRAGRLRDRPRAVVGARRRRSRRSRHHQRRKPRRGRGPAGRVPARGRAGGCGRAAPGGGKKMRPLLRMTEIGSHWSRPQPMQSARSYLFGPMSGLGLAAAAAACLADQALKLWLLFGFDLAQKGVVALAPVLDLRLIWNQGISYGLLQQQTALGGLILLLGKAVAVILLWISLARTRTRLAALSLGLIIGGAIGNAVDRLAYGAVADFVHFHVGSFSWYVFNLADAAIVAGVAGLIYESFFGDRAAKAP